MVHCFDCFDPTSSGVTDVSVCGKCMVSPYFFPEKVTTYLLIVL